MRQDQDIIDDVQTGMGDPLFGGQAAAAQGGDPSGPTAEEMRMWEEMSLLRVAVKSHYGDDPDVAEALKRVTRSHRRAITLPLRGLRIVAAAVVLVVLSVALWKKMNDTPEHRYIAYHEQLSKTMLKEDRAQRDIDIENEGTIPQELLVKGSNGEWVLDYKRALADGEPVSEEVQTNSVTMPYGKDLKIVLADGTEVWLYADSKLVYPSAFTGDERKVYLKGEAYFKVAKNAEKPFIIYTDRMYAKVLGTELNVRGTDGLRPEVVLINGSVKVADVKSDREVTLTPGQKVMVDDDALTVSPENTERYVYWRNGYIYFDDAKLADIAAYLERWYKTNVVFDDRSLEDVRLRFFFHRGNTLDRTMQLLNAYGLFNAEIKNGDVHLQQR